MRHPQTQVNAHSRNPYVLPIFLCVIPNRGLVHPQFFPMMSTTRTRRRGLTTGLGAAAIFGLGAAVIFGFGVLGAGGARTIHVTPVQYRCV